MQRIVGTQRVSLKQRASLRADWWCDRREGIRLCHMLHGLLRELLYLVSEQHKYNFLLWHEEDVARSPDVGDERIAAVKAG